MENHPIPQDIIGFQFKLIGNMTIRQFAYLAAGVIIGWIIFVMPIFSLIKVPIAMLSIILGVGAAFFPVGGRPFDTMLANFLKALFNPTQYIYQKTGASMWFPSIQNVPRKTVPGDQKIESGDEKLRSFLNSLPQKSANVPDQKETVFFAQLSSISNNTTTQTAQPQQSSNPITVTQQSPKTSPQSFDMKKQDVQENSEEEANAPVMALKKKLDEAKIEEKFEIGTPKYNAIHQKVLELEKLLEDVRSQKQLLEGRIFELQKKIEMQKQNVYSPATATIKEETERVKKIPKAMGKSTGIPIVPDIPNLITGVIKDPRGNPLVNILVEIRDGSDNPVRAFKTNSLGQFASATPLANGTYAIFFEDTRGQNKFDNIELNIIGEVVMPLEITSVDTREELRRSLFTESN